jgi:ribosomal protein S18 acetylase RimI-like enzyme
MVNTYLFPDRDRYPLVIGTDRDVGTLRKFLQITYQELCPQQQDYQHLEFTIDRYFTPQTPLWFVLAEDGGAQIACMWVGIAIDQITGKRHPNIFLLYVDPAYRRQGIAHALMENVERWAKSQGYTQIGLQVFTTDRPAIGLYEKLGYETRSISMMREL